MHVAKTVTCQLAGRTLTLETGRLAVLSQGAVVARYGDSVILVAANIAKKKVMGDFFPLMVDYEEKFYAAGKIKGSRFIKREGRPTDDAILVARLIDRSIRPLFNKKMRNDVQIVATVLSHDPEVDPATLALLTTSAAIMLTDCPFAGPIAAVLVGLINGEVVINPPMSQMKDSELDLVVSSTADDIVMVEAGAKEVGEEKMIEAILKAKEAVQPVIKAQLELRKQIEILKREYDYAEVTAELKDKIKTFVTTAKAEATLFQTQKKDLEAGISALNQEVAEYLTAELKTEQITEAIIAEVVEEILAGVMQRSILEDDKRVDGRGPKDIRPLASEVGLLPRAHGSALFQRGITQALSTVTLGSLDDAQLIDSMGTDVTRYYFHHYNFPPYSTGEARPIRFTSRREIGHGDLAERALKHVIPPLEEFPYTIRVVSDILSCNGSTSMASVCGSTLSLMDAGVPIKAPISGIAMGLVSDDKGNYKVLSDIQAIEDFCGDMDFKVTRSPKGITGLQMDIKLKGLSAEILHAALNQAKEGTDFIRQHMLQTLAETRKELSQYAPRFHVIKIDPEKIGDVIGKGGKNIKEITEVSGAEVNIEDSGLVTIYSNDTAAIEKAAKMVERIVYEPKIGEVYLGEVVRLLDFGAIVKISGKVDGMVHISEIVADRRVEDIKKELKLGQRIVVKLLARQEGKFSLSIKAVRGEENVVDLIS